MTAFPSLDETVAVIGLGYVGLPVAAAFAPVARRTIGFDIDAARVEALRGGRDWTGEIDDEVLAGARIDFTTDPDALAGATLFIVTVPTPIDGEKRPDLAPLRSACATIGPRLSKGCAVVFESTVFPGATEEVCGPALEAASGLRAGHDFALGYSPERINPGDKVHRLETITKVVGANDPETLARLARAYRAIVPAGVHEAPSIRVAEAAKVIENTQRYINIALMNELALIFERMGLSTRDVLAAARTKWNFLPFTPGLVGGHCISVDPYYLTAKAEAVGHHPEVILSGLRINDEMGRFVAAKTIKLMVEAGTNLSEARVGLLGMTFKENVPDLRNSRSPDVVAELQAFGIRPLVHDAEAGPDAIHHEFGIETVELDQITNLDGLILAVAHARYMQDVPALLDRIRPGGVLVDLRSCLAPRALRPDLIYWSL